MTCVFSRRVLFAAAAFFLSCLPAPSGIAQTVHVLPYVQPGDGRVLTGADVKAIRWLTDQVPGDFIVEWEPAAGTVRTATATRIALDFPALKVPKKERNPKKVGPDDDDPKDKKNKKAAKVPKDLPPPETDQHYFRYTANLSDLPFNTDVLYRVKLSGRVIREATFRTRATADKSVRCVLVGDMAQGLPVQREVAYQMSRQKPEFLVALGDIVYSTGRVSQYMHHFWDTYNNSAEAGPQTGAPLMASVPFYPVLGNHDISAKLATTPDALAAYYFFSPPKGGPGPGPWITPIVADEGRLAQFRAATEDSYPNLDAYSFDYGAAHFVVLNDNPAMKIEAPEFLQWLRADLNTTRAKWKFVCFHMPGFQSAIQHYTEQQIRPLQPIFEECGVDMTFAGHVHNYQRTVPLRFVPDPKRPKKGKVDGLFTLDTAFDGVKNTQAQGVIHIVAGGGGASLYGPGLDKTAEPLKKQYGANFADFTAKMIVDKHSFVVLDIAPDRLDLRALSFTGDELDRMILTKKQ